MPAGRPTEYTEEILDKARVYLEVLPEDEVYPSIAGLATFIGVARSTIYDWASQESKKEFSDILEQILAKQEKELGNKGLKGEFNSTITKLMLTKHGYSDKQELTGKDGEPLVPLERKEEIDNAIKGII